MQHDTTLEKVESAAPLAGQVPLAWRRVLARLRGDRIARGSAYTIGSYVSLTVLQGLQFFLLARALGSHEFGVVASIVAITSAFLPFSGLGLGNVAIMNISRRLATGSESLGNGLAVTGITAVIGIGLALLIAHAFLDEPGALRLVLLFGISEILLTKCVDLAAHVFLGLEEQLVAACFYNLLSLVRLVCVAALYFGLAPRTALAWAQLHLLAGAFTAAVVLVVSWRLLGVPRPHRGVIADIRKGFFFSIVLSAKGIHTDADKFVLARDASAAMAGAYTAAFRLVYMACLPVTAILSSLQAHVFRQGHEGGLRGTMVALRRLVLVGGGYCLATAVGIYVAAPLVPWLLGDSYQLSSTILRALCLLPCLLVLQWAGSEALSGADAQRRVSLLHALTAGLSLVLNLVMVPLWGWEGAVFAAYGSQSFLVAGLLLSIVQVLRRERGSPA